MRYASVSVVVLCSTLAGCGGGGGGGTASGTTSGTTSAAASGTGFTVTLSPASITASFPAEQQALQLPYPPNVDVSASVVPSSVSTPVYVYLVDPAGVLMLGKQTITKDSTGHYKTKLLFNQALPAGTYTGKLQLQICQDVACATPYAVTGGALPYTITVTPAVAISAKINGAAVASSGISVKDGDTLTLQSNVPVTWSPSQNNVTSGGISFTNVATSSNLWTATLKPALGSSGTTLSTSILATQYVTGQSTPYANKMTPITLAK